MSAGHDHPDWHSADTTKLKRLMENKNVEKWRYGHYRKINREHDLPYLAGYSKDGTTLYIDRHLPEKIECEEDGTKYHFCPDEFLKIHEEFEKALMEVLDYNYGAAHAAANAAEKRAVVSAGIPWLLYEEALNPYIKADEHEKLESVPADLDMAPYNFPPVNRALIKKMRKAMGEEKCAKTEVDYSDDGGMPSKHCGPDMDWEHGYCAHYNGEHSCEVVEGHIATKGWCKLWKHAAEG